MRLPLLNRRQFLKSAWVGTVAVGAGGWAYGSYERDTLQVERQAITLPRLAPEFHGFRIAQISDLHADRWMNRERLLRIVHAVNALKPDLVAITGDFVTHSPQRYEDNLVAALGQLKPPTVAVLGNHDHSSNAGIVREALRHCRIRELNNRAWTLERGKARLHFAGVDDVLAYQDRIDLAMKTLKDTNAAVLLVHEPDFADASAVTGRFDLQLSGHSHGGQIRLPGVGPLHCPLYGRKYPMGLYHVGTMQLYVNRGLGMIGPHVRIDCPPEITEITLLSPRA